MIVHLVKRAFLVYYLAMYRDDATHLHVLSKRFSNHYKAVSSLVPASCCMTAALISALVPEMLTPFLVRPISCAKVLCGTHLAL